METLMLSHRRPTSLSYVSAIVFLWGLADAFVSFFLPIQMQSFLHNLGLFGMLYALSSLSGALSDPIVGFLSNRVRYTVLLVGGLLLSLVVVASALLPLSVVIVIWLMVVWGLYHEFINIGLFSYVSRHHDPDNQSKHFGTLYLLVNVAYAIGPIAGSVLLVYGSSVLYGACAIFLLMGMLLIPRLLTVHSSIEKPLIDYRARGRYDILSQLRSFRKVWRYAAVFMFGIFLYNVWSSFVWTLIPVSSIGGNALIAGLMMGVFTAPFALLESYSGAFADRYGRRITLLLGLLVAGAGTVLFGSRHTIAGSLISACISATGFAFAYPALMGETARGGQDHASELGNVAGIQRMFVNAGFFFGPIMGGILAGRFGIQASFFILGWGILAATLCIAIALIHFHLHGRKHRVITAEFPL